MRIGLPALWVRRLVIDPVFVVVGIGLLLLTIPGVILVLALLPLVLPGRLRGLRLLGFGLVYFTMEVVVLIVAFLAWFASGFGWALRRPAFVTFHYSLLRGALVVLRWFAQRYFALRIQRKGPPLPGDDHDASTVEHPLLVMSRHAGPGDSFLLVDELLSWAGRRPRVVLKHTLQWDPVIDVLLNRLPMTFVNPAAVRQDEVIEAITVLAATMAPCDALLIFPEGGNVTAARRANAIERLRASGREEAARRAEGIVHLMPPRRRGVQAALEANPDLQVVVVAHTGLDDLNTVGDIWATLPVDKTLWLRWHAVAPGVVPTDEARLSAWLFDEWEQMDAWVAEHREHPAGTAA